MNVPVVDYQTVTGDFQFAELYDWQQQALQSWKANNFRGVIEAVTGAGKTRVGIAAIAQALRLGMKATVLVPTTELQEQWMVSLRKELPQAAIGRLGGSYTADFDSVDVIVAIVNSAGSRALIEHFRTGLVVADECHRYAAPLFSRALNEQYIWRLGLTATYTRHDGKNQVLDRYFGSIVYKIWYDEAQRYGVISEFDIALVGLQLQSQEQAEYDMLSDQISTDTVSLQNYFEYVPLSDHDFMEAVGHLSQQEDGSAASAIARRFLSNVAKRQSLLANTPVKNFALAALAPSLAAAERALVFGSSKEQAQAATQTLEAVSVPAGFLMSGMSKVDRLGTMNAFRRGELQVLCAPRVLDEGIDVPAADLAIQTSGTRVQRQLIQRLGRVIRKRPSGDRGRFVYLYAFGTIEDPALRDDFLPDVLPFARDYMYFNLEQHLDELVEFLAPAPQVDSTGEQPAETQGPPARQKVTGQLEPAAPLPRWNDILDDGELAEKLADIRLTDSPVKDYFARIAAHPLLTHEEMVELAHQVEAGVYADHVLTTNFTGSRRERRDYWQLVDRGLEAQEKMLCCNLRLVVKVVKRFRLSGEEPAFGFLDLIQEGNLGLYQAIQRWDYTRDIKFSTYAHSWIWQSASRAMADKSRTIRLPVHLVDDLFAVRRVSNNLLTGGVEPTAGRIAEAMDKPIDKIITTLEAEARHVSPFIEVWVNSRPYQLGEIIVDALTKDGGDLAIETMYREELRAAIRIATAEWEPREQDILYSRWGLRGWPQETLDAIGERHGVTRERIRQIEKILPTRLKEEQSWLVRMLDRNVM